MYAAGGHDARSGLGTGTMYMEKVRPLFTGIARVEKLAWAMYKCRGRQDAGSDRTVCRGTAGAGETLISVHSPGRETGLGHAWSGALSACIHTEVWQGAVS
mgnify:CR=1 FL=1